MNLFSKLFRKNDKTITKNHSQKHNICSSEISQYSSLPRFYYINGVKYDIDSPQSVFSIPLCETHFNVNGEDWGIDTVLREHVNRYYSKIPDVLKTACYSKISCLKNSGYEVESSSERAARINQEKELLVESERLNSITAKDMEQFINIPYHLSGKTVVEYRNVYMEFNELDDSIFLNEIASINSLLRESNRFAKLPSDLILINLKNRSIKCTPYTATKKNAKYPLSVCASSFTSNEQSTYYKLYKKYPDTCGCELFYLQSGTIGKADIYFNRDMQKYHYHLICKNNSLVIGKIDSFNLSTNERVVLYKY